MQSSSRQRRLANKPHARARIPAFEKSSSSLVDALCGGFARDYCCGGASSESGEPPPVSRLRVRISGRAAAERGGATAAGLGFAIPKLSAPTSEYQ
jgi:hypothetical protein